MHRSLAAAVVVIPLVLAGCSDDGSPASTRSTPPTTAETTTTTTSTSTTLAIPTTTEAPPGPPVAATTPDGLAQQILESETAIRNPTTLAADLPRLAHLQQVAYRAVSQNLAIKDAVLAKLPAELRSVADANITANAKLRSMITKPKDTLPPWRIVPPAPAEELLGHYRAAESEVGVGWTYLAAIHLVETRMGRIRGTSVAGAQGPMQFMPATWRQYGNGGDINDNRQAIFAAARLLKNNGAPGDMRNAVWNYNHDHRYVDAVLAFAEQMQASERAYFGYHGWQVYYVTTKGDVWLNEGYGG